MIGRQPIDTYAREISDAETGRGRRRRRPPAPTSASKILFTDYKDPDALRRLAAQDQGPHPPPPRPLPRTGRGRPHQARRQGPLRHRRRRGQVDHPLDILRAHKRRRASPSRSRWPPRRSTSTPSSQKNGIECLETDLGEFIVQLDDDEPSHIVKPIIHKNRREIAETFLRERHRRRTTTTTRKPSPAAPAAYLREKYIEAEAGITGANFVSAESGRIVLVTNEGNSRFGMAPVPVHIVLVGIEKIVPTRPRPRRLPQPPRPLRHRPATHRLHRVHQRPAIRRTSRPARSTCTSSSWTTAAAEVLGLELPRDPPLHPLRRLPERLPGLPPGLRPRLPLALRRPGRRGALAAPLRRPLPRTRRPAQGLLALRRLQRGLPGRHPHPRPPAPPPRQGQAPPHLLTPAPRRSAPSPSSPARRSSGAPP